MLLSNVELVWDTASKSSWSESDVFTYLKNSFGEDKIEDLNEVSLVFLADYITRNPLMPKRYNHTIDDKKNIL